MNLVEACVIKHGNLLEHPENPNDRRYSLEYISNCWGNEETNIIYGYSKEELLGKRPIGHRYLT